MRSTFKPTSKILAPLNPCLRILRDSPLRKVVLFVLIMLLCNNRLKSSDLLPISFPNFSFYMLFALILSKIVNYCYNILLKY